MMPSPYPPHPQRATLLCGLSLTLCVAAACVQHHELLIDDGTAGADAGFSSESGIATGGSGGQNGDPNEDAASTGGGGASGGTAEAIDGGQRSDASSYTSYCPVEKPLAGASCADAGVRIFGGIIPCDYPNGDRCLCGLLLGDPSWSCINGREMCLLEHFTGDVCYLAGESCSKDEKTCTCQSQEAGHDYVWYCR